jgi:hypothetical protein
LTASDLAAGEKASVAADSSPQRNQRQTMKARAAQIKSESA